MLIHIHDSLPASHLPDSGSPSECEKAKNNFQESPAYFLSSVALSMQMKQSLRTSKPCRQCRCFRHPELIAHSHTLL